MTDSNREIEQTDRGLGRRTMLKGAAAAGLTGAAVPGTASAHSNRIEFRSVSDEVFRYDFSVTGKVERERSDDGDRLIGDDRVKGACSKGRSDVFGFSGEIRRLELSGPGKVFVNDRLIRDTTRSLPNRIVVEAAGEDARYRFRVTDRVEKGSNADSDDRLIDSKVVEGAVGGQGVDDYLYSGSLVFESAAGPLTVTLELNQH